MSTETRIPHSGDPGESGVSDADLVRYLDGELDDDAREAVRARLAASPAAAARLDTLRRRSAGLTAILADADPAPAELAARAAAVRRDAATARRRTRFGPTASLKAAAVIALLLVGAFAVPPARAWVVDRVRDAAAALGLATPPPPAAVPTATGADVAVTFAVAGATFDIHVPAAAGVLILQRAAAAVGSAEAERPPDAPAARTATFVVLPAGLRIDGGAPGASYRVSLPPTVGSVRVRAGDAPATAHPLPAAGETLRIELSPGAR